MQKTEKEIKNEYRETYVIIMFITLAKSVK